MTESTSAQDLFDPGALDNYFGFAPREEFGPSPTDGFSRTKALWLAEFSRLIYRRGPDEIALAPDWRTRDAILAGHGWRETRCIAQGSTRAALVVNDSLRVACLVFRGTLDPADMLCDSRFLAVRWRRQDAGKGHVHRGFKMALNQVWRGIEAALRELDYPVYFTGHSLGGALATLAAARALQNPALPRPAALYTFGSPRTGDSAFGRNLRGFFHCRLVNAHDIVASVPPAFSLPLLPVYQHTGHLHRLLPGGAMECVPDDADAFSSAGSAAAIRDLIENVARLFKAARAGGVVPQNLLDHAPQNYVARLAQGGPARPISA